ncbi:MAG: hypothetical protein WAL71_14075 [Terriglobales bacterium]|jgi:hypothetical protein
MKRWLWLLGVMAVIAAALYANRERHRRADFVAAPVAVQVAAPAVAAKSHGKTRPVYQYSLVPGGLRSVREIRAALQDPVLAKGYGTLDFGKLHARRLTKDTCVFVQSRKNGSIFWTKHCIQIHAGEIIWTDGSHSLMARCGNLIAYAPQEPQIELEAAALNEVIGDIPVPDIPDEVDALNEQAPELSLPPDSVKPPAPISPAPYPYPPPIAPGVPPKKVAVSAGDDWKVIPIAAIIVAIAFYLKRRRVHVPPTGTC